MNDFETCAELCEQNGFVRPAELFRGVASGQARAYVVRRTGYLEGIGLDTEWAIEEFGEGEDRRTKLPPTTGNVFLDREAAERQAATLAVQFLRSLTTFDVDEHTLSYGIPDFQPRVSAILGTEYILPSLPHTPLFPESATDQQLSAIEGLFQHPFYEVVSVPILP